MAMELPEGLQKHVFDTIAGAFKSRDVLEAERPVHVPPYDDDRVLLQKWTTLVDRQGRLLAQSSVVPATKAALTLRGRPLRALNCHSPGASLPVGRGRCPPMPRPLLDSPAPPRRLVSHSTPPYAIGRLTDCTATRVLNPLRSNARLNSRPRSA